MLPESRVWHPVVNCCVCDAEAAFVAGDIERLVIRFDGQATVILLHVSINASTCRLSTGVYHMRVACMHEHATFH